MSNNHFIDTSDELVISRFHHGVKLLRPDQVGDVSHISNKNRLGCVKKLPFNVYVLDPHSQIQLINEPTVASLGFASVKDGIGKTMFDILPEEDARRLIHTDKMVVKTSQTKIVDDPVICKDGSSRQFFTVKTPLFDACHKVIGLFGCSVLLNEQPLSVAIAQIAQLGLLQPQEIALDDDFLAKLKAKNIHLTDRELQVVSYLIRGKSARETGEIIHLSQRTVEFYLNSVKSKLHCRKKSELIDLLLK